MESDSPRFAVALMAAATLHLCLLAAFAFIRMSEQPFDSSPLSVDLTSDTPPGLPEAPSRAGVQARTVSTDKVGSLRRNRISHENRVSRSRFRHPNRTAVVAQRIRMPALRTVILRSRVRTVAPSSSAQPATLRVQAPVFPRSKTAGAGGIETTSHQGTGNGMAPSKGVGVLVQGGGQPRVQGSLALASLDRSLAAARGKHDTEETTRRTDLTERDGGSVTGAQGGYRFRWDQPEAAGMRRLVSTTVPRIPLWVGKEGLTLSVLIAFILTPDGVLSDVNVEASSGYNEVDAAVSEAVRHWRFNADPAARALHGLLPYIIRAR